MGVAQWNHQQHHVAGLLDVITYSQWTWISYEEPAVFGSSGDPYALGEAKSPPLDSHPRRVKGQPNTISPNSDSQDEPVMPPDSAVKSMVKTSLQTPATFARIGSRMSFDMLKTPA